MKMKEEESAMKLKTSYKMKEAMAKMKDASAMKAKGDATGDKGSALIPSHIRKVFPNMTNEAYNKNKKYYDDQAQAKLRKDKASAMKQTKPDYPDIDGDGNTTESMKQAAADKKSPMEQKEYKGGSIYKYFDNPTEDHIQQMLDYAGFLENTQNLVYKDQVARIRKHAAEDLKTIQNDKMAAEETAEEKRRFKAEEGGPKG